MQYPMKATWFDRVKRKRTRFVEWLLCGWEGSPPNGWKVSKDYRQRKYVSGISYSLSFLDDAGTVGINVREYYKTGELAGEKWETIISQDVFRKMALWYLWRWAWGEWFGLRRYLYYKRLYRIVEGYKKFAVGAKEGTTQ